MRRFISTALATSLIAGAALGTTTFGASADSRHNGPWYRHGGWHQDYHRGGWNHHDDGAAIAAGIGGLALGAIVGGALASPRYEEAPPAYYYRPVPVERVYPVRRSYEVAPRPVYYGDHVQVCLEHYRSYEPRSDTFLGYDGYRHRCNL
ncbi:BA14K family protein [Jiella sonneratiae]|uniref:Lectin-like protein BA14k n=1 Tax=Jiella sonneratiae TaxID=2816856 RepID=A0ABS3J3X8_9HYPH|nr:BA14K family protein [Jiella sonneratiae]MBO0904378.1 BA14K family protein [Jiella sonneratiae]